MIKQEKAKRKETQKDNGKETQTVKDKGQ